MTMETQYRRYKKPKNNRNVPSVWKDDYIRIAFQLAILGARNEDLANAFDVHPSTISSWLRDRPEFTDALQRGRTLANAEVAEAMYKCAVGFEKEVEEIHFVKGRPVVFKVKKYFPPNPWSQAKFLGVRERGRWSDVQRSESLHANINITKLDLTSLTMDELKLVRSIQDKQLDSSLITDAEEVE